MKVNENGVLDTPPNTTCTGNLLANPGFENSLTSWNNLGGGGTIVSDAQAGSKALSVCGTSAGADYRVVQTEKK